MRYQISVWYRGAWATEVWVAMASLRVTSAAVNWSCMAPTSVLTTSWSSNFSCQNDPIFRKISFRWRTSTSARRFRAAAVTGYPRQ